MRTILIALTLMTLTSLACQSTMAIADSQPAANQPAASQPEIIQDPLLQKAWTILNNLNEPVQIPDGKSLTGHDLAQFIVEKHIAVVWDEQRVCGGNSCSVRYCKGDTCTFNGDPTTVEPIYIKTSLREDAVNQMSLLIEPMAHEIFHRMDPFGHVHDSLYEEYWAYLVGVKIAKTGWIKAPSPAPLQPACLLRWFQDQNLLYAYDAFQIYPSEVNASVDKASQSCSPAEAVAEQPTAEAETTAQPEPDYTLECQANALGLIECQKLTPTTIP